MSGFLGFTIGAGNTYKGIAAMPGGAAPIARPAALAAAALTIATGIVGNAGKLLIANVIALPTFAPIGYATALGPPALDILIISSIIYFE